jgi:hypothetical protein
MIDPAKFAGTHGLERIRMSPFPPLAPFPYSEIEDDTLATQYNNAIIRMREKINLREPQQVLRSYRKLDADSSGECSFSPSIDQSPSPLTPAPQP